MLQQSGHHIQNRVLKSWKLYRGIQLDLLTMTSDYDYSSSISSILNQLNWPSLAIRRQVSRLVMFYKIVHRYVALDVPNEIVLFNAITRGHNMKYRTPFCRVDVYKNSFYPVMIRLWNTLPEDIIYSNSLRQFRTSANFYLTNQSNLPIIH